MKKRILNLLIAFSMLCSMLGSNVFVSAAQKEESLSQDGISIEKATEHDFEKIEKTANDTKNPDVLSAVESAETITYPLAETYPHGIAAVEESIFKNRELYRPLNTGFEELEETKAVADNNQNNQLLIVEEKHTGRFALKLLQKKDEIIPVKESDSFWVSDMPAHAAMLQAENDTYAPQIGSHAYKQNIVNIWVKPMYKAREISFYTKIENELVLIQSDKNGDGIFTLGEDFAQGKWNRLQLNLLKTEADVSEYASGLYAKGNVGSEWVVDDIQSEYMDIQENKMNLSNFAFNNVISTENGLQFSKTEEKFNIASQVVASGMDLSEKIAGIKIDSENIRAKKDINAEETGNSIIDVPFASSDWVVNDANYDTETNNVSKKTGKILKRDVLPEIPPEEKSITVPINPAQERRIRFIARKSNVGRIDFSDGNTSYSISYYDKDPSVVYYTKWFEADVTISSPNLFKSSSLKIIGVEYEQASSENAIAMKSEGVVTLNKNFSTNNRSKMTLHTSYIDDPGSSGADIGISVLNAANEKLYETRVHMVNDREQQKLETVLPKIENAARIEIKSLSKYNEILLSDFSLTQIQESDWNYAYRNMNKIGYSNFFNVLSSSGVELKKVREIFDTAEHYAISHMNADCIVNKSGGTYSTTIQNGDIIRYINLSMEPRSLKVGNKDYWLSYGENDIYIEEGGSLTYPTADEKLAILKKTSYSKSYDVSDAFCIDGLGAKAVISEDGKKVYYQNQFEDGKIFVYDLPTRTSSLLTDISSDFQIAADRYLITKNESTYVFYDLADGTQEELPALAKENHEALVTPQGDIFICEYDNKSICLNQYKDGQYSPLYTNSRSYETHSEVYHELVFNANYSQGCIISQYSSEPEVLSVLKKADGIWTASGPAFEWTTATTERKRSGLVLSNDGSKLFYKEKNSLYQLDLITGTESPLLDGTEELTGTIVRACPDGRLLYLDDKSNIYLYNSVSGEKQKIVNQAISYANNGLWYGQDENRILCLTANSIVMQYIAGERETAERYLLSFDGGAGWYAFKGGRWILSSSSVKPSVEECMLNGMTAEEVSAIKPVHFDEIYRNGSDVVTLNVAIYMNSGSTLVSPVVRNITVNTLANQTENRLSAALYQHYSKSDYTKLHGIFPVESFPKPAEAYYVLSLGNDWLYTFKNEKIVKIPGSADEMFDENHLASNWIEIKQYGMTAGELRSVPEAALNDLLLNVNYANTEFGVICVVRPAEDEVSTSGYRVDYRLQSDANYFDYTEMVVEITVNGATLTLNAPEDISKEAVDKFMSWLSSRQSGKGDIFYRLQTANRQYFINYFMISNVNVYDKKAYPTPTSVSKNSMQITDSAYYRNAAEEEDVPKKDTETAGEENVKVETAADAA